MTRSGGRMMLGVVLVLMLCRAKRSLHCYPQNNEDGASSYNVTGNKDCEEYSWKVSDKVVAHEGETDEALVQESGRHSIKFKNCQRNVSYFCDNVITNCEDDCPRPSGSKTHLELHDAHQPTVGTTHTDKEANNQAWNIVIYVASVLGVIGVMIGVVILGWRMWRKHRGGSQPNITFSGVANEDTV